MDAATFYQKVAGEKPSVAKEDVRKFLLDEAIEVEKALKGEGLNIFKEAMEGDGEVEKDLVCGLWEKGVELGKMDSKEEVPTAKKVEKRPAAYEECIPGGAAFRFQLGHQEMSRVMKELETIFASQPCEWLPVDAMANLLAIELGYEDVAEFEDALEGEFQDFVRGLPNAELSVNERGTTVLKLKKDVEGPPRKMTLQVTERKLLWHVLMQAPDARITIPELEFEIQPMGERRIDTIYNHIGAAVWNLGQYVRDANLSTDVENKILDTIHCLNAALDVENPFTIVVDDPTSRSLWQPIDGVKIDESGTQAQAA
eukprot:TRINITY_DN4936_c0_g1_i1.p1 TRINITY_DN4936_c0_g1~~TRINITY_DN4936_c0_g1_i1.p1  ORF type:complete len:313 (+),score=124.53 TRINITY_DN4936_c0_g1_i1:36-974(+)